MFSCLCSESLSWLTSCSLLWVRPRFSWVSLRVSRRRSRSSSIDTINDSKWPSESDWSGEPEPRRPPPFPPPGPSASLMVGITSHIICNNKEQEKTRETRTSVTVTSIKQKSQKAFYCVKTEYQNHFEEHQRKKQTKHTHTQILY